MVSPPFRGGIRQSAKGEQSARRRHTYIHGQSIGTPYGVLYFVRYTALHQTASVGLLKASESATIVFVRYRVRSMGVVNSASRQFPFPIAGCSALPVLYTPWTGRRHRLALQFPQRSPTWLTTFWRRHPERLCAPYLSKALGGNAQRNAPKKKGVLKCARQFHVVGGSTERTVHDGQVWVCSDLRLPSHWGILPFRILRIGGLRDQNKYATCSGWALRAYLRYVLRLCIWAKYSVHHSSNVPLMTEDWRFLGYTRSVEILQ